jgi:DNA repair exonuclease SbcCD nuclease subunit
LKFTHVADPHLGYRQYGLRVREEDYKRAVQHVVDRSIEVGVNAVVWGGDIFDNPTPSADSVKFVKDNVQRLLAHDIVSIGVDGNHDAADGKWLRVCGIETFNGDDIVIDGISFVGVNYVRPALYKEKLLELAASVRKRKDKANVLVIHQPLGDLTAFGCEITAEWIAETFKDLDLRYVAMGDIHNHGMWFIDGVHFVYPGSVEMTDIDEDEGKHFIVVDWLDDGIKTYVETTNPRPVVRYEVKTQEELEHVMDDVRGSYGGHVLPAIRLNSDLKGAVARLQKEFGGVIPYRLERFSESTGMEEHIMDRNWTRVGLVDLAGHVEKTHAKDSEEYQLIVSMIDSPERAVAIAEEFVLNKGLGEVCKL